MRLYRWWAACELRAQHGTEREPEQLGLTPTNVVLTSSSLCPAAEERDNMQKRLQNLERLILRAEKPGEDKVSILWSNSFWGDMT